MGDPVFLKIAYSRIHAATVAVVLVLAFSGCGKQSTEPSRADIHAAVAKALPPVLSLEKLDYDIIGTSPESLTIKFKAEAKARENLCRPVQELLNEAVLLEVVHAANESVVLYGATEAQKQVDRWSFGPVRFDNGLSNLGSPQSSYPPGSVMEGTEDAKRAIEAHDAFVAQKTREYEEMLAREEERIRNEKAAIKAAQEAEKARLAKEQSERLAAVTKALAPGTNFRGTVSNSRDIQNVSFMVDSLDGLHMVATLTNLDLPGVAQTFAGMVEPGPKVLGQYTIILKPTGNQSFDDKNVWIIFRSDGELKLSSSASGLEGKGNFRGYRFDLKLMRGQEMGK